VIAPNERPFYWRPVLDRSLPTHADTLTGTVVSVADGDTITVLDANHEQHKIRLSGIDAPEKGPTLRPALEAIHVDPRVRERGRRPVAQARPLPTHRWQGDGRNLPTVGQRCPKTLDAGLAQLTVGLAWWYRQYAKEQSPEDAGRYEFAEHEARAKRAGLWADGHPVPPWDWRKGER
jgi:endonuclease YncB( thermonuclease family)